MDIEKFKAVHLPNKKRCFVLNIRFCFIYKQFQSRLSHLIRYSYVYNETTGPLSLLVDFYSPVDIIHQVSQYFGVDSGSWHAPVNVAWKELLVACRALSITFFLSNLVLLQTLTTQIRTKFGIITIIFQMITE